MADPRELLLHELRDILYAEKTLVKTLPKLAKEASSDELAEGFEHHLDETKQQVANLEKVFAALGETPKAEKCPGMDGIKAEHDEFMAEEEPSPEVRDLFLTGAAARTECYEIAAYTSMVTLAKALREPEAARLLESNLKQEKETLKKVEGIARRLARESSKQAAA
jgi:ferritin-like metal-binding protein YciE